MLSRRFLTVVFLAPVVCSAQLLGTKRDSMAVTGGASSPVGVMPLFQMLLALGIVFVLLKFALPKLANKFNKRLVTGLNSNIKIEESANFAGGALYLVKVKGKDLLLSVSTNGVTCLADVTSTEIAKSEPLFMEILDDQKARPDLPDFAAVPVEEGPRPADIQRALDRLARLGN